MFQIHPNFRHGKTIEFTLDNRAIKGAFFLSFKIFLIFCYIIYSLCVFVSGVIACMHHCLWESVFFYRVEPGD